MKLSKKSRYGITALVDIAANYSDQYVSLGEVADRNGISLKYLEQIFASLRKSGIVKSVKGPQGGYCLSRPASEISIIQILTSLEGDYHIEPEDLSDSNPYHEIAAAVQMVLIDRINGELDSILRSMTLDDVEREYLSQRGGDMYYI